MKNLKTLKDLKEEVELCFLDKHKNLRWGIPVEELKAGAVKWVIYCKDLFGTSATLDFWMERFNLTEEDLKKEVKSE